MKCLYKQTYAVTNVPIHSSKTQQMMAFHYTGYLLIIITHFFENRKKNLLRILKNYYTLFIVTVLSGTLSGLKSTSWTVRPVPVPARYLSKMQHYKRRVYI